MRCDQARELIEAYALGALDREERGAIERHLVGCPDCRPLAAAYADTAGMLPLALAAAAPLPLPSGLRVRLLQSVRTTSAMAPALAPSSPESEQRRTPWPLALTRRWWWRPRAVGVLAAAALLALSLVWSVQLSVALARERALRAELASLVNRQEVVLEVVDSPRTVRVSLRPPGGGSLAYGKLYTRPDLPHVVVMAARLPQPPPGQGYHLWLTSQGQARSAGLMAVNSEGFGLVVFDADRDGPVYEAALLSLEPEGSTTLSGLVVLLWRASS